MANLNWSEPGRGGIILTPADVGDLIFSANAEQSRNAHFIVSDAVGANGWIYSCALTVVRTLLAALPNCSTAARFECLDLIAQIASSESAPEAQQIADKCLAEIRNATWYFIWGLQFEDVKLVGLYVDILGCLGSKYDDLKPTVERYLKLTLTRNLLGNDFEMVKNTIADLSK